MASLRKLDNGKYRAQVEKLKVRDSRVFATKREALDWATRREAEIMAQETTHPSHLHTLRQILTRYRDEVTPGKRGWRWETIRIDAMLSGRYGLPLDSTLAGLSPSVFGEYRDRRLRLVKPATVSRELAVLGGVMDTARREWGWMRENPIKDIRKPGATPHRERVIHPWEIRAMLRAMGYKPRREPRSVTQALAYCFLMALTTGMRAGELCGLTWENVGESSVFLPTTKTGDSRHVPLSGPARRIIDRMRGFDPVLVFGLTTASLDALFRKYRQRAGLDGFTFHDTRHSAATRIGLSGRLSALELAKMFGWKDLKRCLTYFNPTADELAAKL
ncbi:MAG: site-specific integrase [Candidatus Accumulibacter sp.]|jgi:integrase|nr:site-specific integrase [Accumulibacter sp.]